MLDEVALHSATELSALLASGSISPVEITRLYIERAKRYSRLNAYVTLDDEGALAAARRAEEEIARDGRKGPLHGLPVAVKDQVDVEGLRTTGGSTILDYVATEDATVVARLRQAGAIMLGKLNLSEFSLGGNVTHPFGVPHNPWDETRQAGQSSSGPGVAVAASLCAAALGGDTAGSIRSPAAWCGIVGLRPTWGRISRYGALPMAWFMDTLGPMTKTVADTAMLFQVIAGHDSKDRFTSRRPVEPWISGGKTRSDRPLEGVRVGVVRESIDGGAANSEVAAAVWAAVGVLEDAGAVVDDAHLPLFDVGGLIANALCDVEAAHIHRDHIRQRPNELDFASRRRLFAASLITATAYVKLQKFRMLMREDVMQALERYDVLVTPTQADPAPKIATETGFTSKEAVMRQYFGLRAHRSPFNLSGVPAIAVPCGFTVSGLPISMQLAGQPLGENALFTVGYEYQMRTEWHLARPSLEE